MIVDPARATLGPVRTERDVVTGVASAVLKEARHGATAHSPAARADHRSGRDARAQSPRIARVATGLGRVSAPPTVLCLNAGSSSLKLARFEASARERRLAHGAAERIGLESSRLWLRDASGTTVAERDLRLPDHDAALNALLDELERLPGVGEPDAIGHRIVHGGAEHARPARIDRDLLADLEALVPFAPLHLPAELRCIAAAAARFADEPQVACFDTAFHRTMPEVAQRLPLPRALWDLGVRRYGFHGLSYEFVVGEVGPGVLGRAVIAHLGNGASAVAVRDGASVDTTMGFTPTGGFAMGTRSGDLDPGVLLHLLDHAGYDARRLDALVNQESGLLGVSGSTPDMKTLLESEATDPRAAEAIAVFCHGLRKAIGALAAVLGGLDTLVFTGGIGQHAAPVRERTCRGLEHLGVAVDPTANEAHAAVISASRSRCVVRVVPTDEERVIARHTRHLVFGSPED
jgi:acetate kinase